MALTLADLKKATRQVHFEYAGETVNLTCRPVSPWARVAFSEVASIGAGQQDLDDLPAAERWQRVQERIAQGNAALDDYIAVLTETIVTWDVLDDAGQPLPITHYQISRFPDEFVHALFAAAVWGGSDDPNAPGATSPATSRQKAR